jgi:competence protein ComEA
MIDMTQKTSARVSSRLIRPLLLALTMGLAAAAAAAQGGSTTKPPPGHPPTTPPSTATTKAEATKPAKLVDINSASRTELKTLAGIGEAEAARIIAGRPYLSKADLVSRNILPEGVYVALRHQIIAKQSGKPVTKK